MKTPLTKILGSAFGIALLLGATSCDNVPLDDRYIDNGPIEIRRSVLLEDFTGQGCLNCPKAHVVMENLEEEYGDALIAVSIHCGGLGTSVDKTNFNVPGNVGLLTQEGQAIMDTYPISTWPMGVIDMGDPIEYTSWAQAVKQAASKPSSVQIDLSAKYEPSDKDGADGYFGTIQVGASITSLDDREVKVQFWIIESGIVAVQKNGSEWIYDYVHNNVFRAQVFDGVKGKTQKLLADSDNKVEGSIATRWTDKERWEIKNLDVVAIVSDNTGCLNAAKVPLFPKEETEGTDDK